MGCAGKCFVLEVLEKDWERIFDDVSQSCKCKEIAELTLESMDAVVDEVDIYLREGFVSWYGQEPHLRRSSVPF
jgi:hypothetical protein